MQNKKSNKPLFQTIYNYNTDLSINTDMDNLPYKNHPLIIFYDDLVKKVYYLVGKSYQSKYDDLIKDNKYILIKPDPKIDFIEHDTVFDTTTIYCMHQNDYRKYFQFDPNVNSFLQLDTKMQTKIFDCLIKNYEDNHIAYKEFVDRSTQNTGIANSTTYYASNSWIKQELSNELKLKNPKLLQQHFNNIDQNSFKTNFINYIHKNNTNQPIIKSKIFVGSIIVFALEDWVDKFNLSIPIDIKSIKQKWFNVNQQKIKN